MVGCAALAAASTGFKTGNKLNLVMERFDDKSGAAYYTSLVLLLKYLGFSNLEKNL